MLAARGFRWVHAVSTSDDALLPVVQKSYDLCVWLLKLVERLPRSYKFTLGDRIQTTALDLQLALVESAHARRKDRPLHRADRLLDQLRLLLRLTRDLELISLRRHEHGSALVAEIGRMLGGWMKARLGAVRDSA